MTRANDDGTRALGDAIAGLLQVPARLAGVLAGNLEKSGCSTCEIPPPCWEPRPAGSCSLTLLPGGAGLLKVHVVNCDWTPRVVGITALGKLAGWVQFQPTTLVVGPKEQATFIVKVHAPAGIKPGESICGPLIIRGCVDHYVRLCVTVAECAGEICCAVTVKDCPDHIHHWYDHFYCPRPCRNLRGQGVKDG